MDPPSTKSPELRFYRVTCTGETFGDDGRRLLVLAPETDPRRLWPVHERENIRTEPARWYEFTDERRVHEMPLTAEEAERLGGQDWQVDAVPGPLGDAEQLVVEQRTARLLEEAEQLAARERQAAESRRLAEEERNDSLWFARLYLKIPHNLSPREWREVEADYHERWCEPRGIIYRRDDPNSALALNYRYEGRLRIAPSMDELRCIVFGWADPRNPDDLRRAVGFYRDRGRRIIQLLQPILFSQSPGPRLVRHLAELEQRRAEVERVLDDWPHSPLALVRFEESLRSELNLPGLEASPVRVTSPPFAAAHEAAILHRLERRWDQLEQLRASVAPQLEALGWMLRGAELVEARRNRRARKPAYIAYIAGGLHQYLRPIYQRTFDDDQANTQSLREHISRLLSPFFKASEVSPEHRGPIWRALNTHLYQG